MRPGRDTDPPLLVAIVAGIAVLLMLLYPIYSGVQLILWGSGVEVVVGISQIVFLLAILSIVKLALKAFGPGGETA